MRTWLVNLRINPEIVALPDSICRSNNLRIVPAALLLAVVGLLLLPSGRFRFS
jgi:hypothetical protein